MLALLLTLQLLASTPPVDPPHPPADQVLDRGEAALGQGQPRVALDSAESLLARGLPGALRQRALALAEAAASALNEPVKARFYRLARTAPEGMPPAVIRDLAEERYVDFVASAEAELPRARPEDAGPLRLYLFDALMALGRHSRALAVARELPESESGELLLEVAQAQLDAGRAAEAHDAAASAQVPLDEEDDDPADERGFALARARLLADALWRLGELGEAAWLASEAWSLAGSPEEETRARERLTQLLDQLERGDASHCALLEVLPRPPSH